MKQRIAVMLLTALVAVCGCQSGSKGVLETPKLAGQERTPWPGDATPFGMAKGRRQVSTWTWRRGFVAIEPYADIISSVSMCSRITKVFVDNCHKADIEVYLPVAGKSAEDFDTAGHIEASVRKIMQQCDELGVDGVDLQYEGFGTERRECYMDYIVALAGELHRTRRKLSVCVNPLMLPDTGEAERYDPEALGEVCDQVRVMCYEDVRAGAGRLALACTRAGVREAMRGWMKFVPREKLVMGLPAYSHDIDLTTNSERHVWYNKPPVDHSEIIEQGALPQDAVNYYVYRDKAQHLRILYATDALSTKAHLATADELDIPAISFWSADRVTPEMWQVVKNWLKEKPDVMIEADADFFTDTITIRMKTPLVGCEVRYTLDATQPTAESPLYTKPLVIDETTTIKARAFGDGRPAGFTTATLAVAKVWPLPADQPEEVVPGLRFQYYEGPWERLPEFASLQPIAEGVASAFDISQRKRDDFFGFRFTGYIKVPRDGAYTFFVRSDDGFRLWIGDKLLIDDYGLHPAREVRGLIALAAGLYPIKVDYFEWDVHERLLVAYQGPGIEKQVIPAEVLFCSPKPTK